MHISGYATVSIQGLNHNGGQRRMRRSLNAVWGVTVLFIWFPRVPPRGVDRYFSNPRMYHALKEYCQACALFVFPLLQEHKFRLCIAISLREKLYPPDMFQTPMQMKNDSFIPLGVFLKKCVFFLAITFHISIWIIRFKRSIARVILYNWFTFIRMLPSEHGPLESSVRIATSEELNKACSPSYFCRLPLLIQHSYVILLIPVLVQA